MMPPVLWGIDPDLLYRWSSAEYTNPPEGMEEALKACGDISAAESDEAKQAIRGKRSQVYRDFNGIPWPIREGAPVLHLAPLSEPLSMELQAAKTLYERFLILARSNLDADKRKVDADVNLTDDQKEATKAELIRKATEENVRRGVEMYPPSLQSKVLSACVKGWENIRVPFSGKWDRDGRVLPKEFKEEAFLAIESGSIFTQPEAEGFTLRPGSGQG